MQGDAGLIQHPGRQRIWWVHLVWVAYMFVSAVFWWWWEFRLQLVTQWTFERYVLVLTYAFLIYLVCALLFPRDLEGYEGFKDYLISRRRWFFGLMIAWAAIDVIDTAMKGMDYFRSLGPEYPIAQSALAVFAGAAFVARKETVHALVAIIFFAYQLSWVLRVFQTVA
jgi:hypothetical protein